MPSVYRQILGDELDLLPGTLRQFHDVENPCHFAGMAWVTRGSTPLHWAATSGTPANIQPLLDAGADAKAKNKEGKTPWDLAQENYELKGTKAYWALNDAQYN